MTESELKERTKRFALRAMKMAAALPKTMEGRTIAGQFIQCATSVGANYRAARRGRSKAEFVAKLGIVEEEADESDSWMELMIEGGVMNKTLVEPLLDEAQQLARIMASSRLSATRGRRLVVEQSKI